MNQTCLESMRSNIDQVVEIETRKGERLVIAVISVFDQESEPDVFFYDVTTDPQQKEFSKAVGYPLPLNEIVTVRENTCNGARA